MKLNKKTIYRVKTQELFDKMMEDAEEQGYTTLPSIAWHTNQEKTAVRIDMDGVLGFSRIGYYQENDDYDTYDFAEYKDIPEIYPINFGCVGIDAPDFKTAYEIFSGYMKNRDNLIDMLNEKVYTVRVHGDNTIVITPDGKVATAKCHPDDEFDIVEGFKTAIEKIREMDRKLTNKEKDILNAIVLLGGNSIYINDEHDLIVDFDDESVYVNIDEDDFKWCEEYEDYDVKELLEKYA